MRICGLKVPLVAVTILVSVAFARAQALPDYEYSIADAEAYHSEYDFSSAVRSYSEALRRCDDSVRRAEIEGMLSRSRNGRVMSGYCKRPKVVARKTFSLKEFYLYYPLPDHSWRPSPNRLDASPDEFSPVVYFPRGSSEVYWSAKDSSGVRNIYWSREESGEWSEPQKLPFSSGEDEIYPMVCGDKLYFASKGLYGVGGYDIYVCDRIAGGGWSEPRNMGFPYSSPADDFLFIDSPDGRYSIFASNRDCGMDSVSVYVVEYESVPVSSSVQNVNELQSLCRLDPADDPKKVDNKSVMSASQSTDPNTALYMRKAAEVRSLREEISRVNRELSALRSRYNSTGGAEKEELAGKIFSLESTLPGLQSKFVAANKDLQKTEMDFLLHGVLIDRSRAAAESDNLVVGADKSYTFTRHTPGPSEF